MITPAFNLTATERVLPKLALDFTTAALDSRVTFARSGNTATRINSSGYIEVISADTPRFDYTLNSGGACKGLLIEEARQNLILNSNNVDNASWNKGGGGTTTANAAVSPDGTLNAAKLTSGGDSSFGQGPTLTNGTVYTWSVYLKAGTRSTVSLYCTANSSTPNVSCSLTSEWQRFTLTFTANQAGSVLIGGGGSFSSGDLYAWGGQLEAGAFATSYIPTTTTALTRNADVATMTGTNFSDWYNQSEGAFVLQAARYVGTGGSMTHFSVSDGTNLDAYRLYSSGADGVEYFTGLDNNVTQWDRSRSSVTSDTPFKLCATYKLNNIAFALNGSAVTTDSIATIPTVDRLLFGQTGNGTAGQGRQYIQKLFYYPQVFTSAETTAFSK